MRYIEWTGEPESQWLARAQAALTRLKAAKTADERSKIIDEEADVWRALKSWLLDLSHQKCWFSEAKDCFSHWDVEHYRPKKCAKDIGGKEDDGYWWLAFDWRNLRVCGNAGNRKKGTFFPLRPGCKRIGALGDCRLEDPQLLDPTSPDDPILLSFNFEGLAMRAADVIDPWDQERVDYSIDRCNLNFGQLMDKRKAVWAECWGRLREYERELQNYRSDPSNAIARQQTKNAIGRVREMVRENQELSAVARACVLSAGDRFARLLQSA